MTSIETKPTAVAGGSYFLFVSLFAFSGMIMSQQVSLSPAVKQQVPRDTESLRLSPKTKVVCQVRVRINEIQGNESHK